MNPSPSPVAELPQGVVHRRLMPHSDPRGAFTEIFRHEWTLGVEPVQWNAVRSEASVLRGVHADPRHDDYLTLVAGRASIGLCDLRESSPTWGLRAIVDLSAASPSGLVIPHGVAHGFLFHEPSVHIYAVTHYWDVADELGCRWDDPELALPWPAPPVSVSPRDEGLPSFGKLLEQLQSATSRLKPV